MNDEVLIGESIGAEIVMITSHAEGNTDFEYGKVKFSNRNYLLNWCYNPRGKTITFSRGDDPKVIHDATCATLIAERYNLELH